MIWNVSIYFIDLGVEAYPWRLTWQIEPVARLWWCRPKLTFGSRGMQVESTPLTSWKPVKRLTILLRRAGQDAGRPVCVVVVFQQYFRWIPVCFIGKGTVASYHSVNQIWSCWVVPTWPSHVKVCMQQNVPYPWDTSLTSYGFDRRGHATTIDWLIRHPLLIAL